MIMDFFLRSRLSVVGTATVLAVYYRVPKTKPLKNCQWDVLNRITTASEILFFSSN